MKVYLQPPQPSRGLQRIADALRRYAPSGVEVVANSADADLTVIYAIGRRDAIERQCVDIWRRSKEYAIIQVCLRSTMSPRTDDWLQTPDTKLADEGFQGIWQNCHVIWSYYDLDQACVDDGWSLEHDGDSMWSIKQFYHAPLGVDASVFQPSGATLKFTIATSGLSRLSESVRECYLAVKEVNGRLFHLGPDVLKDDLHVHAMTNLSDSALAWRLGECEFVSGLRRKEGFELPAAEGLLCGARPILFDTPDYRWAYKEWGEYIEETDRQGVVDQLVELFKRGARPVTAHEREEAAHWFNWERVCGEFWQRCLQ